MLVLHFFIQTSRGTSLLEWVITLLRRINSWPCRRGRPHRVLIGISKSISWVFAFAPSSTRNLRLVKIGSVLSNLSFSLPHGKLWSWLMIISRASWPLRARFLFVKASLRSLRSHGKSVIVVERIRPLSGGLLSRLKALELVLNWSHVGCRNLRILLRSCAL